MQAVEAANKPFTRDGWGGAREQGGLNRKDITEVRSFGRPPRMVELACMCVVILNPLGNSRWEHPDWSGAREMLSRGDFFRAILEYRRDEMHRRKIKRVKALLAKWDAAQKAKEAWARGLDDVRFISPCAHALLQWVLAMVRYYDAQKERADFRSLEAALEVRQALLAAHPLNKLSDGHRAFFG